MNFVHRFLYTDGVVEAKKAARAQNMAVASTRSAARVWPGENAIGKRFRVGPRNAPLMQLVRIVGDVRGVSLDRPLSLTAYIPYWRFAPPGLRTLGLSLAVRTSSDTLGASCSIRELVHGIDPEMALAKFNDRGHRPPWSMHKRSF